jgi:hypothetical protein
MQGLAIKVTHLGLTTESLLLSDIFDGTDGPDHNRRKPGAVYVPANSSVELAYTDSVAHSFESGTIRGLISQGYVSARFVLGDAFPARSLNVTIPVVAGADSIAAIAVPADGTVSSITASVNLVADAGTLVVALTGGGNNLLDGANTGDLAAGTNTATLTTTTADLDLSSGDSIVATVTSDDGGLTEPTLVTLQIEIAG